MRARRKKPGKQIAFRPLVPWPDPVDGEPLLDDLAHAVEKHIVLSAPARDATALWILHAHAHDAAQISPLLIISSPEKGCGKSTLGHVISALVPNALPSSSTTSSALFRAIEDAVPTVIIDEADTFLGKSRELRGLLNSGHFRAIAVTMRTVGGETRGFSTWAPKVIIGIEANQFNGTLIDRSVVIELRRRTKDEPVEPLRLDRMHEGFEPLRRQAATWVGKHLDELRAADPEVPNTLKDRARDNWRPLLAIAAAAGDRWRQRALAAALHFGRMSEEHEDDSPGVQLLADIRQYFEENKVDRVSSADLLEWLCAREDRPWAHFNRGKPMTAHRMAALLRRYEIVPDTFREGSATPRGYERDQFADAFARYLPSE